jgi:hypothetical protein
MFYPAEPSSCESRPRLLAKNDEAAALAAASS